MITELFIKQCEMAEEIQKLCEYKMGDWFYATIYRRGVHKGFMVISVDYGDNYPGGILPDKHKKDNFVTKGGGWWLPTQEQLFEIAHRAYNKNAHYKSKEYEIIADFVEWMLNSDINKYKDFNLDFNDTKSCLLIYIMEEFYNKTWAGKDWITIEGGE